MYAQLYILGRSFAIGAAVLSLGACANVDQDAAFGGLKTTLGDRVTQDLAWRQDAASDVAVAAKVNALVANELGFDSAVQVALLNNRALQASYAEIGIANADLVEAGLLSNPVLDILVRPTTNPSDGSIHFDGQEIAAIPARASPRHALRKRIQMVFQDPTDSLNPRFTAERAIADPILRMADRMGRDALRARCEELAGLVGLPTHLLDRFPHQLSGGQKARVGIARAIALNPDLVILDEPTAALDVSVQAVVLNLLQELKITLGMSYLFVSHDLHVVRLLCDRVIVMRTGRIVEQGTAQQVLEAPTAGYTRELLAAVPHPPA